MSGASERGNKPRSQKSGGALQQITAANAWRAEELRVGKVCFFVQRLFSLFHYQDAPGHRLTMDL